MEKCIHIRSIPRELKTEGLEKQIERIKWEAKEKYRESVEEALEETGWERLEEGTIRTQVRKQIYMMKGKEKIEEIIRETEKRKENTTNVVNVNNNLSHRLICGQTDIVCC